MVAKKNLLHEIETLPANHIDEVMNFVGYLKHRQLKHVPETMILSELVLSKDWDTPEEDEAWADL